MYETKRRDRFYYINETIHETLCLALNNCISLNTYLPTFMHFRSVIMRLGQRLACLNLQRNKMLSTERSALEVYVNFSACQDRLMCASSVMITDESLSFDSFLVEFTVEAALLRVSLREAAEHNLR